MMYGFGGNYTDILRHRLGQFPPTPQGIPQGGLPFEGGFNPGYKGGGGIMGFPNPLARLQPFLSRGRRRQKGLGPVMPY